MPPLFGDCCHVSLAFSTPRTPPPALIISFASGLIGERVLLTCASPVFLPFAVACNICFPHLNEHIYGLMAEYGFVSTATRGKTPTWMTCTKRTFSCQHSSVLSLCTGGDLATRSRCRKDSDVLGGLPLSLKCLSLPYLVCFVWGTVILLVHCVFTELHFYRRHVAFVYQSVNMLELCLLCLTKYLEFIGDRTLIYRDQFQIRHGVSSSS